MIQDDGRWILQKGDIIINESDIEAEVDYSSFRVGNDGKNSNPIIVSVYIETWFDVDLRFGTKTHDTDDYINLYAYYDPHTKYMRAVYNINYGNGDISDEIKLDYLDKREYDLILSLMKEAGLDDLLFDVLSENIAYDFYIKDWCDSRNKEFNTDYYDMKNYDSDNGFNGESFACFGEFRDAEFRDEGYMKYLLSELDFELWKNILQGVILK